MTETATMSGVELYYPPEDGGRELSDRPRRPMTTSGLMTLLYDDLTSMASRFLSREVPGHDFDPSELVHESYLKVVGQTRTSWQNREHFMAVNSQAMRRILVDHARTKHRKKRGGKGRGRVELQEHHAVSSITPEEFLAVDELLTMLAESDPLHARILELRIFGGLDTRAIAEALCVSSRTIERHWSRIQAWLLRYRADAEAA